MTPFEQDTVVPLHSEPEPTPTTLMGLQVSPMSPLTSLASMPMALRIAAAAAEEACAIGVSASVQMYVCSDSRSRRAYVLSAGAAGRRRRVIGRGGCGGRKKGKGERGEDSEAGEHICYCCVAGRVLCLLCWRVLSFRSGFYTEETQRGDSKILQF